MKEKIIGLLESKDRSNWELAYVLYQANDVDLTELLDNIYYNLYLHTSAKLIHSNKNFKLIPFTELIYFHHHVVLEKNNRIQQANLYHFILRNKLIST